MLKLFVYRNFKSKYFFVGFWISCFFCINYYSDLSSDKFEINDYNYKCVLPRLKVSSHFKSIPEKKCKQKEDWGTLTNSTWYFKPQYKRRLNIYLCLYRAIIRFKDDSKYDLGAWYRLDHGSYISNEVIEVECKRKYHKHVAYNSLFVQFINRKDLLKDNVHEDKKAVKKIQPLDIILLSYDSVSRPSWLQRLPKTNKFMFETMKFELLEGYNIVGDGTPAALIPIYTGHTEEELPNVLKNSPKAKYVDEVYPFIWKELHQQGYVSMHLEDWPHIGAFNYRMKGFSNKTCHHYFKHYQMALLDRISKKLNDFEDLCIGARKRHQVQLDLMLQFKRAYNSEYKSIGIMHYVENSHDRIESLEWIDNDLFTFLKTGFTKGLFNNTAIFLYSDHGTRFSYNTQTTKIRYLEERLPFFSVFLPQHYREIYPDKYNNLKLNSQLLTSPFDIYATVRELSGLNTVITNQKHPNRSISLLSKMSDRNCEDIGITEHFCTCIQAWTSRSIHHEDVIKAVQFTIDSINTIIESANNLCVKLNLKKIISAEVLKKVGKFIYKIKFKTEPNDGVYESMVVNDFENNYEFTSTAFSIFSRNDISRMDAYGEQPKCVSDFSKNPEELLDIRKFCYCKDNILLAYLIKSIIDKIKK